MKARILLLRDLNRHAVRSACVGLSAVALSFSFGCAKNVEKPPVSPDRQALNEPARPDAVNVPEHVAPPPAYGNKVVLAEGESPTSNY